MSFFSTHLKHLPVITTAENLKPPSNQLAESPIPDTVFGDACDPEDPEGFSPRSHLSRISPDRLSGESAAVVAEEPEPECSGTLGVDGQHPVGADMEAPHEEPLEGAYAEEAVYEEACVEETISEEAYAEEIDGGDDYAVETYEYLSPEATGSAAKPDPSGPLSPSNPVLAAAQPPQAASMRAQTKVQAQSSPWESRPMSPPNPAIATAQSSPWDSGPLSPSNPVIAAARPQFSSMRAQAKIHPRPPSPPKTEPTAHVQPKLDASETGVPIEEAARVGSPPKSTGGYASPVGHTQQCVRCCGPVAFLTLLRCPVCRATHCGSCVQDMKQIATNFRCPVCGEEEENRAALQTSLRSGALTLGMERAWGNLQQNFYNFPNSLPSATDVTDMFSSLFSKPAPPQQQKPHDLDLLAQGVHPDQLRAKGLPVPGERAAAKDYHQLRAEQDALARGLQPTPIPPNLRAAPPFGAEPPEPLMATGGAGARPPQQHQLEPAHVMQHSATPEPAYAAAVPPPPLQEVVYSATYTPGPATHRSDVFTTRPLSSAAEQPGGYGHQPVSPSRNAAAQQLHASPFDQPVRNGVQHGGAPAEAEPSAHMLGPSEVTQPHLAFNYLGSTPPQYRYPGQGVPGGGPRGPASPTGLW